MQVNNASFAQAYQTINRPEITDNTRAAATAVIGYKQPQDNLETYTQAYQNASGNNSSNTSSDNLSYSDIQDINKAISRQHVSNSDMLSNYMSQQDSEKPVTYSQAGLQAQGQTGGVINTYA